MSSWEYHAVYEGLPNPHDVCLGDMNGDGRDEIVVRGKDGSLQLFRPPIDPRQPWPMQEIAPELPGDGTAVAPVVQSDVADIVTNVGWFENVEGDGSRWIQHPFIPPTLDLHLGTRVVVGNLDGNVTPTAVVTESEIPNARMVLLRYVGRNKVWEPEVLIEASEGICGLHSLQLADLDGDGAPEIFTAEMENGRTDGVESKPRWWCLSRDADGRWDKQMLLNRNLGSHTATAADFDGDGRLEIVGKVWRANAVNGAGGRNHVDYLTLASTLSR